MKSVDTHGKPTDLYWTAGTLAGEIQEQFTGLTDRNGVEIYEGDILSAGGGLPVEVYWDAHDCAFKIRKSSSGDSMELWHPAGQVCEVIGNKFENPELVK